ncbi:DUF4328 domain-containing protein [Streptomyces sp. NPDC046909]|uniref:DUF4328 domain-containing protein n=1 Tax=Streptomyces sp. NPDC046909 TaxID=3155617 RepID=UPI00340C909F
MTEPVRAMTEPAGPGDRAPSPPWLLARLAQAAIAVAAAAEVFRATTVRAHRLHPESTSAGESGFASMVLVYAMTLAAVLFLLWFSRCRRNARALSPGTDLGSDAWAVIAWFVPVVNLWVPRGLLLGTQRASGSGRRDDTLVNAWWVAWAGHVVLALAGRSATSLPLLVATQALNIAAAVLVICVVQRVTGLQGRVLGTVRPGLQGTPTV